jgi:hypothetical protein
MAEKLELIEEILDNTFRHLSETKQIDETTLKSLVALAKDGKLKDAAALQALLRSVEIKTNENT